MVNYQFGKIYKIVCDVSDFVYVGSTCQSLCKRWVEHKSRINKNYKRKFYEYVHTIGIEYFHIILIKYFPCNNKEELFREEQLEYDKIKNSNKVVYK